MTGEELTERERRVLAAVIQSYVETAEPAGSRLISRRFGLGVSPATIRNTMSDLEDKGFLFHPHTSAGRVPTDIAYRVYVDSLLHFTPLDAGARDTLLERLELIRVSAERLLLVLRLGGGAARSIFVEVPGEIAETVVADVAFVLNERLAGLTLREIRSSLAERLRDRSGAAGARELLNIFIQGADQLFEVSRPLGEAQVLFGEASVLAEQPEFARGDNLRKLVALTDRPETLSALLRKHTAAPGISITIGTEHTDPALSDFTVVTAEYHLGALSGVIGVIGPTRMPYEKVISLVTHTSRLISDLLE